jgi:hypothetical protein
MSIKYINIFHCEVVQNLPKLEFLVWKNAAIWQPCRSTETVAKVFGHFVLNPKVERNAVGRLADRKVVDCKNWSTSLALGPMSWFLFYARYKAPLREWRTEIIKYVHVRWNGFFGELSWQMCYFRWNCFFTIFFNEIAVRLNFIFFDKIIVRRNCFRRIFPRPTRPTTAHSNSGWAARMAHHPIGQAS